MRSKLQLRFGIKTTGKAMSDEDMKAELDRLRNENAALKKGASSSLRLKVSEKGALSVYGMGRFPVTLYKEQWLKLLGMADEIRAHCRERRAIEGEGLSEPRLSTKVSGRRAQACRPIPARPAALTSC
jgi:hypothetical protein